jgi:hypothetical protein
MRLPWHFYTFIGGAARFMFSWDSEPARTEAFYRDLKECVAKRPPVAQETVK